MCKPAILLFVACAIASGMDSSGLESMKIKPGTRMEIPWPGTPEKGSLRVRFRLDGIVDTFDLPTRQAGEIAQVILLDTPLFQANLNVESTKTNLHLFIHARETDNGPWVKSGLERIEGVWKELPPDQLKVGVFEMSHLRGDQWYELVVLWDLPTREIRVVLNGIEQGDLFPASKGNWQPAPQPARPGRAGGVLTGKDVHVPVTIALAKLLPTQPDKETVSRWAADVPPLLNEGRVEFRDPIKLPDATPTLLREAGDSAVVITPEADLFNAGKTARVRVPSPDEWVLEGPGRAFYDVGILTMENLAPGGGELLATAQAGHQVLWIPWELPENFLLEYDFTPKDSGRGLHILFWNAQEPEGKSIFDLEAGGGFRNGVFAEYLWRSMRSYHASVFATDDTTPRRVANLRKNPGFVLAACGEDAIAGHGPGPFRIRLLRLGTRMEIEVDGRKVMEFEDDGRAARAPLRGGIFGFRIMAHTGSAQFSNIRLFSWDPRP